MHCHPSNPIRTPRKWEGVTALPDARLALISVSVGNDTYLIARDSAVCGDGNLVFRLESSRLWSEVADLPVCLRGMSACAFGRSHIHVFRRCSSGGETMANTHRYDIKADEWSALAIQCPSHVPTMPRSCWTA